MKIKYKENTDLNLIDVFISIWEGKIKIIAISIISFALANIYFNYISFKNIFFIFINNIFRNNHRISIN